MTAPPAPAGLPVVEVGYLTFAEPDTATAAEFYGELFGWAGEAGNAGEGYVHIANTKLPMGLTPGTVDEAPTLYFRVADVDAYAERVTALGGRVEHRDAYESGPSATCVDPQGRRFHLWQPAPGYE